MRSRPNSSLAPMCSSPVLNITLAITPTRTPKLPLYWVANLHASYQLDEHVQFFGLINNLFNNRNATFGTFFNTGTNAQQASQIPFTSDPRIRSRPYSRSPFMAA
jgi:outer membrane receptor protein involved in Fe transport